MDHSVAEQNKLAAKYLLGELSAAERDAFEEHYFDCSACARQVRSAAMLEANLRAVFQEGAVEAAPERSGLLSRWFEWLRVPTLAYSGAALLACITTYQNVVTIPALRNATSAQVVTWAALSPAARGDGEPIELRANDKFFTIMLDNNATEQYASYRCEILKASGEHIDTATVPGNGTRSSLPLLLPADRFSTGYYVVVLRGLGAADGSGGTEIDRYRFSIRKQ